MTTKEMKRDWEYQRVQQIKRLFASGTSRDELCRRFGKTKVEKALDKRINMIY